MLARPAPMSDRMRRVNESVRAVVAEGVGDLKDPRIGMVTVTGVQVTPDLQEARIYVSVLGNERKRRRDAGRARVGPRRAAGPDRPRAEPAADAAPRRSNTIRRSSMAFA